MDFDQPYLLLKPVPAVDQLPVEIILSIIENFVARKRSRLNNRALIALSRVSRRFNSILIDYLAKYNVQYMGSSGMSWAVSHNDANLAEKLLKNGASITRAKSGYPLLVAVKKGDVDMLNFLLATASKDQVDVALVQGINDNGDTVLHRAVRLADPLCVKALLEAGANPGRINRSWRPVDYLYKLPNRHDQYAEIIRILIQTHPKKMLKARHTTPLSLAVEQKSPELVWLIVEAGLEHCTDEEFAALINPGYSKTPLRQICNASNWNDCYPEACDRILAIAEILVRYGADVNFPTEPHCSPLYMSCSVIFDVFRHQDHILDALRLQRDMIRFLLQSGANANEWHARYGGRDHSWALARFLDTAEAYVTRLLEPAKPCPEPLDILEDSHALLMFEENTSLKHSPSCTSSDMSSKADPEEDKEQTTILKLLQNFLLSF